MSESMADHKPQNQTRLTRAVDQAETLIPDTGMAGGGTASLQNYHSRVAPERFNLRL